MAEHTSKPIIYVPETVLSAVRNEGNRDRMNCVTNMLHSLKYTGKKHISITEFDAFLISATSERFGVSVNRDIVLMAFGLLEGYHYAEITEVEARRGKYLTESDHLQVRARKKESYADATNERKKALRDNLRKMEDRLIHSLAYYLAGLAKNNDGINEYIESHTGPIAIPQPSYILLEDEPESEPIPVDGDNVSDSDADSDIFAPPEVVHSDKLTADDGTSEEIDKKIVLPSGDDPANTEDQQDSRSKKKSQADASDPPPTPTQRNSVKGTDSPVEDNIIVASQTSTHISADSDNQITIPVNVSVKIDTPPSVQPSPPNPPESSCWSKQLKRGLIILVLVLLSGLCIVFSLLPWHHDDNLASSQEKIGVPETEVTIEPTNVYQLVPIPLTDDISNEPFEYSSENPNILSVSLEGYVTVSYDLLEEDDITVDVTITKGSFTRTVTFSVETDGADSEFVPVDLDNFMPAFTLTQQVRLVGSSEWSDSVDAKVGDKVEFWIQYRNTSDATQSDVMIRDVLPTSLRYVAGTTKLWNDHLNGAVNNENTIATTGINIGNYGPNANAHVRFQAEVVEDGLACGGNVLGNWAQASATGVLLQNATVVNVNKSE